MSLSPRFEMCSPSWPPLILTGDTPCVASHGSSICTLIGCLVIGSGTTAAIGVWQLVGALLEASGAALALTCILTFVFVGGGTPAPFDPPRRLVVRAGLDSSGIRCISAPALL